MRTNAGLARLELEREIRLSPPRPSRSTDSSLARPCTMAQSAPLFEPEVRLAPLQRDPPDGADLRPPHRSSPARRSSASSSSATAAASTPSHGSWHRARASTRSLLPQVRSPLSSPRSPSLSRRRADRASALARRQRRHGLWRQDDLGQHCRRRLQRPRRLRQAGQREPPFSSTRTAPPRFPTVQLTLSLTHARRSTSSSSALSSLSLMASRESSARVRPRLALLVDPLKS